MFSRVAVIATAAVLAVFGALGVAHVADATKHPTIKMEATSVNPVAATHTVTTTFSVVPDSGYDGNNWGYDSYTQTFTWDRVKELPAKDCSAKAARCFEYDWSLKLTGHTETIEGQESPGEPFTPLDVVEDANLTGTMSGEYYSSYKRVYTQYVPSSYDANGVIPTGNYQPQQWFALAQPSSYEVNVTASDYSWSFSYTVPKGNDAQCPNGTWHWVDSSTVTEANSGNILAPDAADCAAQS